MVEEVLFLIEAQARVKNVMVSRDFASHLPSIPMDKGQIQQMLMNLCANAIDAMPKGGTLTFRIGLGKNAMENSKECVRFDVKDTGDGIPEELRHRIFEPFFTTKEVGKGTGLGLSLAYEIVKSHQGEIALSSEVGKGSCFQVYLPLPSGGALMPDGHRSFENGRQR